MGYENQFIYIATDNLESVHQKLLKLSKCKYIDSDIKEMPWGERLFYAKDPFGNLICFVNKKNSLFRLINYPTSQLTSLIIEINWQSG